jgi:hypothetical protein
VAKVPGVRRALGELAPGLKRVRLELRSGESLEGEFVGFDGRCAAIRTPEGEEAIEAAEVIDVLVTDETEGPE